VPASLTLQSGSSVKPELAGARTEQIAEEAGVNKALLYYYFKSKEDLYAAALESVFESVRDANIAVLQANVFSRRAICEDCAGQL